MTGRRERRPRSRPPADAHAPRPGLVELVQRWGPWIAVGLAVLHFLLALITLIPTPHTGGDNTAYLTLARSLLERGEYLSLYEPGDPAHVQYPPVFPGILAAAMAVGLEPWVPLKIVVALMSSAAVAFTFLWLRRAERAALGLAVGLVLALAPGVLEQGRWILSDVPFWCFTMLALWAFAAPQRESTGRFAIGVAALTLAYFTRSAGLPLVLAAFAWLALRRDWKRLAIAAAIVVPLALLWWLRARGVETLDYAEQFWLIDPYAQDSGRIGFGDLVARIGENARKYVTLHLPILLFGRESAGLALLGGVVLALAGAGWAGRIRRPTLPELFLPLYLGLLLVWPAVWSGERFLLPALPLLLFYAGAAFVRLAHRVHAGAAATAGALAAALLILVGVLATADAARAGSACRAATSIGGPLACLPAPWLDFFATAEWARTATDEDAVVLSRKPRLFYWFSGRKGRIYPLREDPDAFFEEAESIGADYVVLDALGGLAQVYVVPALLRKPDAFCIAIPPATSGTAVFGIRPDARSIPDRPLGEGEVGFPPCENLASGQ